MAKYEKLVQGDFPTILKTLEDTIMGGSVTASLEESSDYHQEGLDFSLRVFERYSYLGKNRTSLALTLVGKAPTYWLTITTSGGSQAMFWKINTWGEEAFLDTVIEVAEKL